MRQADAGIVIVGGGFTGAMLAARLAERGIASTLINRTANFGLGVAYSTPFDGHLLNVRSSRMSALAHAPGDFTAWLAAHHPALADPDGFAPRRVFGDYVRDRLEAVERARPGLIHRLVGEVASLQDRGVVLADGTSRSARAIVLATGNPAPATARSGADRIVSDPWAPGALDGVGPDDAVAIVGTGLTMVDMLLLLEARGWRGRATAVSRRGLLPRAHDALPDAPLEPSDELLSGPLSGRLATARRLSAEHHWRRVMEGLRPITAELWSQAEPTVRARMVRHLRPFWDVHRHRLAPGIAGAIDRLVAQHRLEIFSGRVTAIGVDGEAVRLDWRSRREGPGSVTARWVIDCTGPGHAADRDPLTAPLIQSGRARLDPLRLGMDLDPFGRVLNREGRPDPTLFVVGPPARAAFWETIAVPDIRRRIEDVVVQLA